MPKFCVDCSHKKESSVDGSYDNRVNAVFASAAKLNGCWCLVFYVVGLCFGMASEGLPPEICILKCG